jgi:type II secretory pathway pseudopilin PulG
VNPIARKSNKKRAFTIVELLTVMSIIIILMGLLAPVMNKVRRFAWKVSQKNQFHSIDVALEMFRAEFDGYPDSISQDATGAPYCGAMKLAEAMVGQDLLGFHPNSRFLADGTDGSGQPLYDPATVTARNETYIQLESANAYRLNEIYASFGTFTFPNRVVLCDVYSSTMNRDTGKKIGMPILYFKANTSNSAHDVTQPLMSTYNYVDNDGLVLLGMPWAPGVAHPMASAGTTRYDYPGTTTKIPALPGIFYEHTKNDKITTMSVPYRSDSYILLSAGFDGEYGTKDDVYNFNEDLMDFVDFATP